MNRWKNRGHAHRNLNNSCDTTTPVSYPGDLPSPSRYTTAPTLSSVRLPSPRRKYAVLTCRDGVNTTAGHSSDTTIVCGYPHSLQIGKTCPPKDRAASSDNCQESFSIFRGNTWGCELIMKEDCRFSSIVSLLSGLLYIYTMYKIIPNLTNVNAV